MSDIINIDQFETVENIEISVFPTYTEINVNRITGGGGGGAVSSVNGQIGDVVLTKTSLGLGNVDNTSDVNKAISSATQTALDLKVDKITGKGLSSEDYTTAEKTKLGTIATGAEVNVNADWNATTGDAVILNKPTIPTAVTQTSQLTNNGANGTDPFITALDIPTAGQAGTLVREVKNMTGATLTKGTVVYISGANGNKALVSKALAVSDELSSRTFGLLQSDILNNGVGNCVIIGDLTGLNTSAFAEGAQLYLSGVTAGTYTSTKTLAPTHLVYVGKVTRSHPTQGQIEVGVQNGYEISEIHDISINGLADKQLLSYESSTSLWKNKTIDKTFVGLDNIDNTSDANKPVSTAQATALALKQNNLKTFNRTQGVYYFEEFMGNQLGAFTTSFGGVISAVSGGTTRTIQAGVINRTNQQGVIAHLTGIVATNFAGYLYGGSSLFIGTGAISLETYVTIETLSNATDRFYTLFGYILGGNLANLTNGILFTYDEGGSANSGSASTFFRCLCINNSTRTYATTNVTVNAGQWYKLRIDVNNAGNSVGFYIDGNLVATITTNIPATTTALTIGSYIIKTTGINSRQMQTDYFMYDELFTNQR